MSQHPSPVIEGQRLTRTRSPSSGERRTVPEARAATPPGAGPVPSPAAHLRIGGLTPLTTVDYPGELAAIVFCQGCPWRCRYCHNGHLLPAQGGNLIAWTEVRSFLVKRRQLLDAVVFSGGEPTLQSALPAAMAEAKAMGYKVGLHTAGPYPERLRRALPYVDWVGLDIKALPEDYPAITGVPGSGERAWDSLWLLLQSGISLEVRTTPMPGHHPDDQLTRLRAELSQAGVYHHVIQQCRTERTNGNDGNDGKQEGTSSAVVRDRRKPYCAACRPS